MDHHARKMEIEPTRSQRNYANPQPVLFRILYAVDHNLPLKSYAGVNRLYNTRKTCHYYLLDIEKWKFHTNDPKFYCYQEDAFMNKTVFSTSRKPNTKFVVSKCLSDFFCRQKIIPSRIRNKYFNRIRQLMLQQYDAIKSRVSSRNPSNRKTKTYFRFNYKNSSFYLGIYNACGCGLPSPYVMSNNRFQCAHHLKEITQTHNSAKSRVSQRKEPVNPLENHVKYIQNERLGLGYEKRVFWADYVMLKKYS